MQRKIVLYVPDDLSKSIKALLQQNNCIVLRDLPYCSLQTLEDTAELKPDVVILSEYIKWDKTDLLKAVRDLRRNCSTTQIITHIRERRRGDIFLHILVSLVVYDIILNPEFNIREILEMIQHPNSYGDVYRYQFPNEENQDMQLPVINEQQRLILTRWEEEDATEEKESVISEKGNSFIQEMKLILLKKENYIKRIKQLFINERDIDKRISLENVPLPKLISTPLEIKETKQAVRYNIAPPNRTMQKPLANDSIKNKRLILVIGTDRYVGTTTVAVNLANNGQTIYYPEGYNQNILWPDGINAESINMRDWGKWINHNDREEILIDCGHYTKTLDPWIVKADVILLIAENRSKCLESASSMRLTTRTRLIINKATPDGIKPIILSRALNIPYSAVIPYDPEYRHNFGLALNRSSWNTLRGITQKIIEGRVN